MNTARHVRFILSLAFACMLALNGSHRAMAQGAVDADANRELEISTEADVFNLYSDAFLLFDAVFVDGRLEAATRLVAEDAVIHTDRGSFIGPQGLLDALDRLTGPYPDAAFKRTDAYVVGNLVILRWQVDLGESTHHGRTLAIIEDGQFVRITILDERVVSMHPQPRTQVAAAQPELVTGRCPLTCDS